MKPTTRELAKAGGLIPSCPVDRSACLRRGLECTRRGLPASTACVPTAAAALAAATETRISSAHTAIPAVSDRTIITPTS
jgi:hypothetical protein